MTVKEYNEMMEAKGAARVWVVDYALSCPGLVSSKLFLTEEEARTFANKMRHVVDVYRTWDIWNFTKRSH